MTMPVSTVSRKTMKKMGTAKTSGMLVTVSAQYEQVGHESFALCCGVFELGVKVSDELSDVDLIRWRI